MPITQQHAERVAASVVGGFEGMRRDPGDRADPRVGQALRAACMEALHLVAAAADPREVLLDVKPSYSYKAALRVSVTVTLLVATDRRLWIARHADGVAQEPLAVAYEAVHPVAKLLTVSVKVEQQPQGVVITANRGIAEWLQALQAQRPTQTAEWLAAPATSQAPAAWHPDPSGRHQLRWWDGSRWSEHVSDNGVASVDPVA